VTIVIGKAGATIKRIQDASKASLAVGRANNNMVVTGSVAAVGAAVRMVNQLLADADCTASVDLSADRGLPGAVLGKSGETIKRIQKESGARLDIKRQEGGSVVVISGTRTQVGAAQRAVMAIVAAETGPPPCGPGEKREAIDIDAAQVSVVIGRGGQSLATLNKKSGATVVVRSLADGAKVFVVGGEEAVAKGVKEVNALLKRWSDRNAQEKAKAEKKVADAKAAEEGAAAGGASPEMFGMSNPMNGGKDSTGGRSFALSWADEAEADEDLDLEFVTPLKPVGGAKEDGELSEPRAETLAQKLAKSAAADSGKGTADWGAPQVRLLSENE
jgi:polyribonucleotide nucleotidyltransferase